MIYQCRGSRCILTVDADGCAETITEPDNWLSWIMAGSKGRGSGKWSFQSFKHYDLTVPTKQREDIRESMRTVIGGAESVKYT